jgi:putative ABC transport system ATP-binding protein
LAAESVDAPLLELRGVAKTYVEGGRERRVLDRIDLTVRETEIVVLLGRSGSGKSTLLNLIGGLDAPDEGEVRIAGRPIHRMGERERTLYRRRRVGFVFQFFNLVPTLTVIENVLLPSDLDGRADGERRQRARELLDAVGLVDRAGSFPDRLSGGEQQRVAIARALAADPELVLADEPTGNLDLATGRRVIELLDRLTRQAGKTLVMATHGQEVMGVADRIVSIEAGRLVEREAEAAR